MGQLEDLLGRQQQVANNIEKSCNGGFDLNQELEKARSGIYADNAENRRLHRVGQKYGSDKKPEEQGNERQPKQGEENSGYQKMASQASDGALKRAAADEEADPKVREMAKQELKKRGSKGNNKEMNKMIDKMKENSKWASQVESIADIDLADYESEEDAISAIKEKVSFEDLKNAYDKFFNNKGGEESGKEEKENETEDEYDKQNRRYGEEENRHDWYYYKDLDSYLDAENSKKKEKALKNIVNDYEKYESCALYPKILKQCLDNENLTEKESGDLKYLLDKINDATPYSEKPITSKEVGNKIKDAMEAEWGEAETRQRKKLMKNVKDAAKNFLEKNKDLNLSSDEMEAIVEGVVNTEEEYSHLTKLEGFKELDAAIEEYIDADE